MTKNELWEQYIVARLEWDESYKYNSWRNFVSFETEEVILDGHFDLIDLKKLVDLI